MRCEDIREKISASIDGELAPEEQQAVAAHLNDCADCARVGEDWREIGDTLRREGWMKPPVDLAERIRLRLDREELGQANSGSGQARSWAALTRQAAALVIVAGLAGAGGWKLGGDRAGSALVERDVLVSHTRSLMQDATTQIASSDRHTVKPWFTGRLDFAPAVQDLSVQGFPLRGGRLEQIGDRRVATVVYMRRQHVINLYMWPAEGGQSTEAPKLTALKGYNVLSWVAGGLAFRAISDLNAAELQELQRLIR